MILTTTPTIQGHNIETYYGIVTSEVIIGANVVKDFFASIHDFFGGRAGSYENVLVEAKEQAIKEAHEHYDPILAKELGREPQTADVAMVVPKSLSASGRCKDLSDLEIEI